MDKKEELKTLSVFSKKIGEFMELRETVSSLRGPQLVPAGVQLSWLDKGWNNSGTGWQDKGWSNGSSWIDKGWSNGSSWSDKGWSNGSSWSDSGWSNSGGGGGCFITTACVEHMGLSDDCEQLNILRMFRDKLVEEDELFREIVLDYYKKAPSVVKKINESDNKDEVLEHLYNELVVPCVEMLKNNQEQEAKEHYINTYKKLLKTYEVGN